MAVILPESEYTSPEGNSSLQQHGKAGFELNLSLRDGSKDLFGRADDYLVSAPQTLHRVESRDAQVPEVSSEPSSIQDLSLPNTSQTLDTPSIIDSIVDVLPFRFHNGPAPDPIAPPGDILSAAAASAMLGIDTERFQDITELVNDPPMPMVSQSPAPLLSPTSSIYSDVTLSSPDTLQSAASTSRDSRFFAPDFDMIEADPMKAESSDDRRSRRESNRDNRYAEMRRRNNIASRRSRLTRREKEREMEQQLKLYLEENAALKTRVKNLEEVVERTKKVIIDVVTKRQQ